MYAVTENAYEDLQRLRKDLVYLRKIIHLQNDLITRLLAGECTAKIMGELADVRQDIADL